MLCFLPFLCGTQVPLPCAGALWYITRGGGGLANGGADVGGRQEPRWEGPIVPSTEERVIEIVCENLGVNKEQVTRSTSFIEDVGAASLDIVDLVMEREEEFEITIPRENAAKIKTVGDAMDYI